MSHLNKLWRLPNNYYNDRPRDDATPPSPDPTSIDVRLPDWRALLALTGAYPLAYALGYLAKTNFLPAAIWPADALPFAAYLVLPARLWPLVAVATASWELLAVPFLASFSGAPAVPIGQTMGFAVANCLTAVVPAALARLFHLFRSDKPARLAVPPLWIVAVVAGVWPGALLGNWTRVHIKGIQWFTADVSLWAIASMVAITAFGPAVVGMLRGFHEPAPASAGRSEGWTVGALIIALFFGFAISPWPLASQLIEPMLLTLPLVWLALRFSRRATSIGVAAVALGVTVLLSYGTQADLAPAAAGPWRDMTISIDIFLLTACGGTLLINLMTLRQRRLMVELAREHEALKASESRLRTVVQGMPVLMEAFDEHGLIAAWNTESERVSGYTAGELVGNPAAMTMLYPEAAYRQRMLSEIGLRRDEDYRSVWKLTAKDGSIREIEWFNVGRRLAIAGWREWRVGIDITERRQTEAELRQLEAAFLGETDRQQTRLGRELHDGLGQELTGLSLLISSLAKHAAAGKPIAAERFEEVGAIARQAILTARDIARGLSPLTESSGELIESLRRMVERVASVAPPTVKFRVDQNCPVTIDPEACNHVYRIAQEALSNALRHSGASDISMHIVIEPAWIRINIADNGIGLHDAPGSRGLGLRTMRFRVRSVGGSLTIFRGATGGCTVECQVPQKPVSMHLRQARRPPTASG
ncbi:MAG TPA: PAS domain S-box protein [Steroidobacteraceae bacterium]|nr:PAS domain S-box protein [Steroidobacteraceae bacterium]